jgi:hypothetical protein
MLFITNQFSQFVIVKLNLFLYQLVMMYYTRKSYCEKSHGYILECERFLMLFNMNNGNPFIEFSLFYKEGPSSLGRRVLIRKMIDLHDIFYIHKYTIYHDMSNLAMTLVYDFADRNTELCRPTLLHSLSRLYALKLPSILVPARYGAFIEPTYITGNYVVSREFLLVRDYRIPFHSPPHRLGDCLIIFSPQN